jgi:hypothetical protein
LDLMSDFSLKEWLAIRINGSGHHHHL